MNVVPIDTRGITFTLFTAAPKLDENGVAKTDRQGHPQYSVQLVAQRQDNTRASMLNVTVTDPGVLKLAVPCKVKVTGLEAGALNGGNLWFRAERVELTPA